MATSRVDSAWFEKAMGTGLWLKALGADIERDAIAFAPFKTGELKASIGHELKSFKKVRVGSGQGGHPSCDHAAVTELGSAPHRITIKSKKVLANAETGEIFGKTVQHPGTTAQPYLSVALYRRRF